MNEADPRHAGLRGRLIGLTCLLRIILIGRRRRCSSLLVLILILSPHRRAHGHHAQR